jgi:hydrogenase-4 component E
MIDQLVIALLLLVNLRMFATSRVDSLIRGVALQAFLLVCLAVVSREGSVSLEGWAFLSVTGLVKCAVLPAMMMRALRSVGIRREVEPLVGYRVSLFIGLIVTGFSIWAAVQLPMPDRAADPLAVAAALVSMITGIFLIVARRKAISQAIGYLAMENGVYVLAPALAVHGPLIVETGVLLDVFVGVFIMGVIILHIRQEFKHIDIDRLSELRD